MSLRLEYFVVSDSVAVDALTNRVSLFNVLEVVRAPSFPAVHPAAHATSVWITEDEDLKKDYQTTLRIIVPGGEQREYAANFTVQGRRHRLFQRIEGIPVPQAGRIVFELLLNGKHAAQHIVEVELVPEVLRPTGDDAHSRN